MIQTDYNQINLLIKDIRKHPPLTPSEQLEYFQAYKNGDESAKEKLILSNLRLVITNAKKYASSNLMLADCIQAGCQGLILSIERFDSNKGKLSNYMITYIKKFISEYMKHNGKTIRIPTNRWKHPDEMNPAHNPLQSLDIVMSEDEFANSQTFGDMVEDQDDTTLYDNTNDNLKEVLANNLSKLKPRVAETLRMVYYDGMTLTEIAEELGTSREAIRQRHEKGLSQLRELLS